MGFLNVLIFGLLITESKEQVKQDYSSLDHLFLDFLLALKSGDPEDLKIYCANVYPDENTASYIKSNIFTCPGLPKEKEKVFKAGYKSMVEFKAILANNNLLKNLSIASVEDEKTEILNQEPSVETSGAYLVLKSGGNEIICKFGGMFKINGTWKSFSEFKFMM